MEIIDKIDLILGISLFALFLVFFFIQFLIKVRLEQNKMQAYSMMGIYWLLNIGRIKSIIHKDSSASFLYYLTIAILIAIGLIILYFILMILFFG